MWRERKGITWEKRERAKEWRRKKISEKETKNDK